MYVMSILKHSPESCASFNDANKKVTLAAMKQLEPLATKHGVKLAGFWNDVPGHTVYSIFDTPSMDACLAMMDEPEMAALLACNTSERRVVKSLEETKAMF